MKKLTLFLLFTSFALAGYATKWTVVNSGFTFSPATITIHEGDTVVFNIAGIHTVVEVSQTNWNNNNNTPLPGGFSLGNGGGTLFPDDLPIGTHFYVCGPHASMGMKGKIIVETSTATQDIPTGTAFTLLPNPTSGKFQVDWSGNNVSGDYTVEVLDLAGRLVYSTKGSADQRQKQLVSINLAGYPKGFYVVRLQDEAGLATRKLVLR